MAVRLFAAIVICCCSFQVAGQEPVDSVAIADHDIILISDTVALANVLPLDMEAYAKHSPAKAAMMSAVVPGLGQVYNRDYWKVPIVYIAIGISVERFIKFQNQYKQYVRAYIDINDNDPYTNYHKILVGQTSYSEEQQRQIITRGKDKLRTWRDYAIVAVIATYALNIIDANVFAHLIDFNLDDNISLNIQPCFLKNGINSQKFGLTLQLTF